MAEREDRTRDSQSQEEELIELTDVIENDEMEESKASEGEVSSVEMEEETPLEIDLSFSEEEETPFSASSEPEESLEEDLDFDALFEELEGDSEGQEKSEEDEGEITGGIYHPESEDDFDALLEDLDQQHELLASEEDSQAPEGQSPEELLPEPEQEPSIDQPAHESETTEEKPDLASEPAGLHEEQGRKDDTQVSQSLLANLQNRLDKLEETQKTEPQASEDELIRALNNLTADSAFWSQVKKKMEELLQEKIPEQIQSLESRIKDLQDRLNELAPSQEAAEAEVITKDKQEEIKQNLRQEILQEMESRIPAAAARVIREEIEKLSSEEE